MKALGYVYFIVPVDGPGRVKIGYSRVVERRTKTLTCNSPYELALAAKFVGTKRDEYFIHWRLRDTHVHSEWFTQSDDLAELIRSVFKTGRPPAWFRHADASTEDLARFEARAGLGRNFMRPETRARRVSA